MSVSCRLPLLAGVCAAALFAASAIASPVQVRDGDGGSIFSGGPGSVNLTIAVDGVNQNVAAGAFMLQYRMGTTGSWIDFATYCLEPDELSGIPSNSTPVNGTLVPSLSATTEYATSASALSRLYATWFQDSLSSATRSAAFQVAVWELAYDTGSNLDAGAFRLVGGNGVRTQALAYLDSSAWQPSGDVGVILRIGNQDLLVQVPEPMSLALFGLGLAGLFAAARRRAAA